LWSALALAVWSQDDLAGRCNPLDTTRFSLTGDSVPESDEHAMAITPGSAQAHRPALQQAVCARMVSQDGGVPLLSKRWEGHASETQLFQERAQARIATLQASPSPRSFVADATLSTEAHAIHRQHLGFLTRMPGTRTLVTQVLPQARRGETWQRREETTRSPPRVLCHDGIQRWLGGGSQASLERAETRRTTAGQRDVEAMTTQRFPLHAQRCEPPTQAEDALSVLAKTWRDPQVGS
jgi:transposase